MYQALTCPSDLFDAVRTDVQVGRVYYYAYKHDNYRYSNGSITCCPSSERPCEYQNDETNRALYFCLDKDRAEDPYLIVGYFDTCKCLIDVLEAYDQYWHDKASENTGKVVSFGQHLPPILEKYGSPFRDIMTEDDIHIFEHAAGCLYEVFMLWAYTCGVIEKDDIFYYWHGPKPDSREFAILTMESTVWSQSPYVRYVPVYEKDGFKVLKVCDSLLDALKVQMIEILNAGPKAFSTYRPKKCRCGVRFLAHDPRQKLCEKCRPNAAVQAYNRKKKKREKEKREGSSTTMMLKE